MQLADLINEWIMMFFCDEPALLGLRSLQRYDFLSKAATHDLILGRMRIGKSDGRCVD